VDDRAQCLQRTHRRLIAVSGRDKPDRAAIEIGPLVLGQLFEIIERVLDQSGDGAVIARRGDQYAIGAAHRLDHVGPVGQSVTLTPIMR
jgi:hypothetical protein